MFLSTRFEIAKLGKMPDLKVDFKNFTFHITLIGPSHFSSKTL